MATVETIDRELERSRESVQNGTFSAKPKCLLTCTVVRSRNAQWGNDPYRVLAKSQSRGLVDGPVRVWELGVTLGVVKGVHLAAPPGYGSRTQKEKINGQPIEKSNKFSRRRTAPAKRRNGRFWLFFEV